MIEEAGDGSVVILKLFEPFFHPVVRSWFPDKLYFIRLVELGRGFMAEQLKANLII